MNDSRFVNVTRAMTDRGTTVFVTGELDEAAGPPVRRALINAIVKGGVIDVDLSGVTFADSGGLRALLDGRDFADQYHVGFEVVAVAAPVRRLLSAAGIPDLYDAPIARSA